MKSRPEPWRAWLTALLLAAGPAGAQNQPVPIEIEADRATVNERAQTATYTGNVVTTRGTLTIHSDVLTLYGTDGELDRAVAEGDPARCERAATPENPALHCRAQRITYRVAEGKLHLQEQGRVEQGDNVFESETIVYDLDTETVEAGHNTERPDRVRATIYPQQDDEPAAPADSGAP